MQATTKNKLADLQMIISKMPLEVCCVAVLPEFGVRWREVSQAVRNARLPMTSASVARILRKYVVKSLTTEEIDEILGRLRLKLVATQSRVWYLIKLLEPIDEEQACEVFQDLPGRVERALRRGRGGSGKRAEIESVHLEDMVYLSVRVTSPHKQGAPLYVAAAPGEAAAFVSTLRAGTLISACVEGLGYKKYEDANLYGRDMRSLLRIHERSWNEQLADHLAEIPEYAPTPVVTDTGIDYTNKVYDDMYVENLMGPDPPLLTDLSITTVKPFFDPSMLKKDISLSVVLKSEDVARTLKTWVSKKALAPNSDFFQIFHQIKSNKFVYDGNNDN